jgi:RNA polymerase sigma-70 factor (ECF subfamily)
MAGAPLEVRGAQTWAKGAVAYGQMARVARPALLNGEVGIAIASDGRLTRALVVTFAGDKIAGIDVVSDPERLRGFEFTPLAS